MHILQKIYTCKQGESRQSKNGTEAEGIKAHRIAEFGLVIAE
jgi:hypothetical protein